MRKALAVWLLVGSALVMPVSAVAASQTLTGSDGQRLTASQVSGLKDGQLVRITGTGYNKKVGIYLAFCELPKKGSLPTNCAGGMNLDGDSQSSYWISSNPPAYGGDLVKAFTKRGGFILNLRVPRFIGDIDCANKKCAILTRADHTMPAYRRADVVIPVSFRK